jgi:hypothetical protein
MILQELIVRRPHQQKSLWDGLRCTDAIEVPLFSAVNNREYLNESPVINDMPTKEMRKMISTLGPFRFFIQPVLEMVDAVMSARYQYGSTAGGIE